MIQSLRTLAHAVALLLTICASMQPTWALDATSITDDHSINAPTAWWTYTNVTPATISTNLAKNGARLTDLEVYAVTNGIPTFTVRMVKNGGAYTVPAWWWYYGLTPADIATLLDNSSTRLIELEPYDAGGGVIRFAAILVPNTGTFTRSWHWLHGVSSAQVANFIGTNGDRLIDLDSYVEVGVKKYSIVSVANVGIDHKNWEFWFNQTVTSLASKVAAFNGRVVKIDRQADGTYNFVQVENTNGEYSAWWHHYGFASLADIGTYAAQLAVRPVDITTYKLSTGQRRYDAAFIDNANPGTRRMRNLFAAGFNDEHGEPTRGIYEAFLKRIDPGATSVRIDLNSARRAETASALKVLHLLHSLRQVQAGNDDLNSAFSYYAYPPGGTGGVGKDACPDPQWESTSNLRTDYDFRTGLGEMMSISDNRTTRGVVLRYGGFAPINATATFARLTGTRLRHNIGCAYFNLTTQRPDPDNLRNETTAADLARIWEGVWNGTLLNNTNNARLQFLLLSNPSTGAGERLREIIVEEALALGKPVAIANDFADRVKFWGKGGRYGTCMAITSAGDCSRDVRILSGSGLIQLPAKDGLFLVYRTYAFARLVSDVPVPCFDNRDTDAIECPADAEVFTNYGEASNELYRDEIRAALSTW